MYRRANEPHTWDAVYDPADILGYWIRAKNIWRDYAASERARYEADKLEAQGFYQHGESIRCGAEPVRWDMGQGVTWETILETRRRYPQAYTAAQRGEPV